VLTMSDHPLTTEPREARDSEETYEMEGVDVRAEMSPDGKRVTLDVTDAEGDETRYELRGLTINGTAVRADGPLTMYDVDAVIEWQAAGLGMYPAVDVRVTPPEPEPSL